MPNPSPNWGSPILTIAGKRIVTVTRWSRRGPVRFVLLVSCVVFAFAAVLAQAHLGIVGFRIGFGISLAVFIWPFVEGPYLLYTRRSMPLRAGYSLAGKQVLDDFAKHRVKSLELLGFDFTWRLERSRGVQATTHLAFFTHREAAHSAQLANVVTRRRTRELLIFRTKFSDGLILETSNGRIRPFFPLQEKFRAFRFPQVRITKHQYELHRELVQRFTSGREPVRIPPDEAADEYSAAAEEVHRRSMGSGDFKLNGSGDAYRYTVGGAIRHAWSLTWPIREMRVATVFREANGKAKELGYSIDPKFGHIRRMG